MQNALCKDGSILTQSFTTTLRIMRLIAFFMLVTAMHVSAKSISQATVTFSGRNVPIKEIFTAIKKQTGYVVFYDKGMLKQVNTVTVNLSQTPLEEFLQIVLKDLPLDYTIKDKTIFISKKIQQKTTNTSNESPPVSGIVRGPDGQPLSGVNVMVKGTNKGTVTDKDGKFSINADEGSIIEVSSIGYGKKEIQINSSSELNISLEIASSLLDEVQYIAYGQTTKRFNVGNIGTVKASDIEKQPVQNPLLAMQGRVSGLYITQSTGLPGTGVTVRIQGQNSLTRGNDPLYVIDGVPYVSQLLPTVDQSLLGGSGGPAIGGIGDGTGSPLSYINPADIESIEVLKDADATAIYGSRAANGAILITTKKGKVDKTKVGIDIQNGWGKFPNQLNLLNTQQYLQMRHEAINNDGLTPDPNMDFDLLLWDTTRYTDWQKELIGGTAKYLNVNGTISGGTQNIQYFIGSTYHRETTVFPGSMVDKKGSVHFSINSITNNQKFRVQLSGNYLTDNNLLSASDPTSTALLLAPDAPEVYKADGTLNWSPDGFGNSSWTNPLSELLNKYRNKTNNLISNAILSYKLLPSLEISANLGYNNLLTNETFLFPLSNRAPESIPNGTRVAIYGENKINSWIVEPQVNYVKNWGKGKLAVLIGTTILQNSSRGAHFRGAGYNDDEVMEDMKSASSITVRSSIASEYKYTALFGRLNYIFNDRYIANLTARRDGSSRFGSESQFHNFGAIGLGWIFSNENLFKNNLAFISFGKLRGSYGTTGNDQIGDYQFLNLYSPIGNVGQAYQGAVGIQLNGLPNPYLEWEETRKLQVGIDLGFVNDRFFISTNYYHNRSSNQLLPYALPYITGFNSITTNFPATVENTGWEFTVSTTNIRTKDLSWTSNFNLTLPRNKLVSFPDLASSSYADQYIVGQPVTLAKVYRFMDVDPATGIYQFADANGHPTSTPDYSKDRTVLINTSPKLFGGFQNNITYKSFQLDFLLQFVQQKGRDILFGYGNGVGVVNNNQPEWILENHWQKQGDIAKIQRYSSTYDYSSQLNDAMNTTDEAWADASYIRLKNLSFSWQIPKKWSRSAHLQSGKIYTQGQNLFTITNYKGLDPETLNTVSLPPLRVWTIGVQVIL